MKKTLVTSLALAVGSLLMVGSAMALPTLELTSGTATATYTDSDLNGQLFDSNKTVGSWNVSFNATTTPYVGSTESSPLLTLFTMDVTTTSIASPLTVTFTDDTLDTAALASWLTAWKASATGIFYGSSTGSVETVFNIYDNGAPGTAINSITYSASSSGGSEWLNGNSSLLLGSASDLFTLEMISTITPTSIGSFTSTAGLTPTPEPASMLLLGSGLVGLAGAYRRKKAATTA